MLEHSRLNRLYRDSVKDPELMSCDWTVLTRYARERHPQERFGDWCARVLWNEPEASAA
jgi:sulfite reductase beta subunit-like hemoprotein